MGRSGKIVDSALKEVCVVVKVSDTHVAAVAEKAANAIGVVTVIQMKISPASRIIAATARAFAVLRRERFFVPPKRDAISGSKAMVFSLSRVGFPPSLCLRGRPRLICQTPLVVTLIAAGFAIYVQAVQRVAALVELLSRFRFFTTGAKFRGRIEECFLHRSNTTLLLCKGQ